MSLYTRFPILTTISGACPTVPRSRTGARDRRFWAEQQNEQPNGEFGLIIM